MAEQPSRQAIIKGLQFIAQAVVFYMCYNVVVGMASMLALAIIQMLGGIGQAIVFRRQIAKPEGHRPYIWHVAFGALGALLVTIGLKYTQSTLGIFAAMQLIYDCFVVGNSFAMLAMQGKKSVRRFDLILHLVMATLVTAHVAINWDGWSSTTFITGLGFALTGALGYFFLNSAIAAASKNPASGPATRACINFLGGVMVLLTSFILGSTGLSLPTDILKLAGGAGCVVAIIPSLGAAYERFGQRLRYLVPVLVYDGLLVLPALAQIALQLLSHAVVPITLVSNTLITLAMVSVMLLRAPDWQDSISRRLSRQPSPVPVEVDVEP